MREILFRGKIKGSDTGVYVHDWAFGDLVHELSTGKTFILDLAHFNDSTTLASVLIEVDPSTVGQFTGLTDKNGVEIFEGDVAECYQKGCSIRGNVVLEEACFFIKFDNGQKAWLFEAIKKFKAQVIGNIYDTEERHDDD